MDTVFGRSATNVLSRSRFAVVGTVLAFLIFATTAFAQDDPGVKENQVQIKLTESAKSQFVGEGGALPKTVSVVQQTGISALDQVAQQYTATQMERVFRPAGKHEPRHVEWGLDRWYIVHYEADTAPEAVAEAYRDASTQIETAAPVYEKKLISKESGGVRVQTKADEEPSLVPDDPEYSTQWHYNNTADNVGTLDADINLPEAHNIETGDSEVIVSITDTGVDLDHPDLEPMLWTNEDEIPGNGEDDDNNGFVDDVHGYDHVNGDSEPEAGPNLHATHVSGTVGAKNDNGQFGAGIAGGDGTSGTGVQLMLNKVFHGTGLSGISGGFAEAITYAADNGAHISQNSWGGGGPDTAIEDAIEYFRANAGGPDEPINGGLPVFAAGNDNLGDPHYPAFYEEAFAVGASNENDGRAEYSNFGDWVDIAAPGGGGPATGGCGPASDDVWSTLPDGFGGTCGTSMATPHVSGVVALVASASPGISPDVIEETLVNTAEEIDTDEPIGPRVNALAALQALGDDEQPPAAIDDLATTNVSGNEVSLEWLAPGDDGDTGTATSYDLRMSMEGPIETESDFENAQQIEGVPLPDTADTVQSHTVSGLPYNTEVHFAIRAVDEVGNTGALSNSPSATTDPGPAISVSPESFDVSLEVDNSTDEILTISHAGEPGAAPLEWTAAVGPAPNLTTTPSEVAASSQATSSSGGQGVETATEWAGAQNEVKLTDATYQLDDGTSENALGFGAQGDDFDAMWLNAFQVVEGAGTVTSIATTWGNSGSSAVPPEGKEGLALVYNDPNNDGDPSDAELLTETEITVQDPGTNNFTTVSVPPTPVEGTFFIAVLLQNNSSENFPMPMDESSAYQEASWAVATTDVGNFDKENLSNNQTLSRLDNLGTGFPANWLLRAEGSAGFIALNPTEGSVSQGGSQDVTATFDATGVTPGIYEASINVSSNDPGQPVTSVPSTLEVTSGPPGIAASPSELDFGGVFTGTTANDTITVTNTGGTALQVTDVSLSGSDAFVMLDSTDTGGFNLPFEESREIEIQYAPTESNSANATLDVSTEEGVSASVLLQGEGQPFVSISPDQLEQEIDLTTGDSTATQSFTITNEFDESLPFSVLVEQLEGENVTLYPKLTNERLRRWQQIQQMTPESLPEDEITIGPLPQGTQSGPVTRLFSGVNPLDATGVTGYGNEVIDANVMSFDLGLPGDLTVLDDGFDSYAGNFAFANQEEVYWIENGTHLLKTYNVEDGSVGEIGELDPIDQGSDDVWTDMETDPTTGTTYVTRSSTTSNTNRLYELDPDDAELSLVGEFAAGDIVIAFAIDGEGEGYAHDISNDQILGVDLETAEAEAIGPTGITATAAQSMTYDHETGQVLMAALHGPLCGFGICESTLRQVNRETGNTTLIGAFEGVGATEIEEFGWMATPGKGIQWLAPNLEQGVLPAGATLTLEAQYDASGLVEGDYEAQISIVGDQLQGEPSESLPVNLAVEAAPVLFLSSDGLTFDSTFVNDTTSAQMVTLRNDGAANMTVTDVSIGSDAFHLTPSPDASFTLEPGEARLFNVQFTPQATGEATATLSFGANEVSGEVSLTGVGTAAPELAFSPESFEKQAYLGQEQEHKIEVSNTGGNPLEYDLTILPSQPPAEDVLLEEETFDGSFPPEGWSRAGANNGENWMTDCFGDPSDLLPAAVFCWGTPSTVGTQRLISPEMDTEGLSRVVAQFDHTITNFDDAATYELRLETSGDGGNTWTTAETWAPQDLPITQEVITIDNEDVGSDEFHLAWTFDGDSFQIDEWGVDNITVFAEGSWLAVEPGSGTIAPGESDSLTVMVDTNVPGLEEGTYQSGLNFATNDPLAETAEQPFTLNVIESVSMTMDPQDGDEVNPNETFEVDFNVESLKDLQVFSYQMEMGFAPDSLEVQEVITEGTLSEELSLETNIDNENGTLSIAAAEGGNSQNSSDDNALFSIEGEGTLVTAKVKAKQALGETILQMNEMLFNEGAPPASTSEHPMEIVPLYGDVNLNQLVAAADATNILKFTVGKIDMSGTQTTHADVSGNELVAAFDASLVLRWTVGDVSCFPVKPSCESPEGNTALARTSESGGASAASVAWGEPAERSARKSTSASAEANGQAMVLPLKLDQTRGPVHALQVRSEIDPNAVSVEGLETQLPDDWRAAHHVSEDGILRIAMFGATPIEKSGEVATVLLRSKEEGANVQIGGEVTVNESGQQPLETASIAPIPDEFGVSGTYPNPFSQRTTLEMQLPKKAEVTVSVYDVLGRKVETTFQGQMQAGASRTVQIDGSDLSAGTYFYRVTVQMGDERRTQSGQMAIVR